MRYGIFMFNVETLQELEVINSVARRMKTAQKVAIRLNPALEGFLKQAKDDATPLAECYARLAAIMNG